MAVITEIAPNIYCISVFAQWGNLQFNLVKDDEPLLFHTGLRGMHAEIREVVARLINLAEFQIGFSAHIGRIQIRPIVKSRSR
jgi:hypothetical protein